MVFRQKNSQRDNSLLNRLVIAFSLLFAFLLTINRYLPLDGERIFFDFPLRNYLEHFVWGFTLPLIIIPFFLGFDLLVGQKPVIKPSFITAFLIFFVGGFVYYFCKVSFGKFFPDDPLKIIIDFLGLGLSYLFLKKNSYVKWS